MAEIDIYIADVENTDWERAYAEQGSFFEQKRISRIEKCSTRPGKKTIVCTGLLIYRVLSKYGVSTSEIAYDEKGKPFLRDRDDLFFNVSNSGKYVVMAISDKPVGIDVQKTVEYKENLVKKICSEAEIENLKDVLKNHLNLVWAVKEAYTKLTGTGIATDIKNITYSESSDGLVVYEGNTSKAYGSVVFSKDGYETVILSHSEPLIRDIIVVDL